MVAYTDQYEHKFSKKECMNILSKVIVVEGDLKAPFSIATTPRDRVGSYSFSWIAPLTLEPYLKTPSAEQGDIF